MGEEQQRADRPASANQQYHFGIGRGQSAKKVGGEDECEEDDDAEPAPDRLVETNGEV